MACWQCNDSHQHDTTMLSLDPDCFLCTSGHAICNIHACRACLLQGRYLPNSKWAPCGADEQALAEDAHRLQVNNVAGMP